MFFICMSLFLLHFTASEYNFRPLGFHILKAEAFLWIFFSVFCSQLSPASAVCSAHVVGMFPFACLLSLQLYSSIHARWSCVVFKTEMHFIMVSWLMVLINQGPSNIATLLWKTNWPPHPLPPPDGSPQLLLMEVIFTDTQLPTCCQGNSYK